MRHFDTTVYHHSLPPLFTTTVYHQSVMMQWRIVNVCTLTHIYNTPLQHYTFVCVCACASECVRVCVYICQHACVYVCVRARASRLHMYICIHIICKLLITTCMHTRKPLRPGQHGRGVCIQVYVCI